MQTTLWACNERQKNQQLSKLTVYFNHVEQLNGLSKLQTIQYGLVHTKK